MDERVDAWGENQKAARRNVPRKRARIQRAFRRAVNAELQRGEDADPTSVRRETFKTWVGPTRSEHLKRQAARRETLQLNPRRTKAAQARRRKRLNEFDGQD